MIDIRQAAWDDWPAIAAFVAANYGADAAYKHEARWNWQMRSAPFALTGDDRPPSWIAVEGGEVVGQISLQPARLHLDDMTRIEMGWIVDVMVAPAQRGLGLGHRCTPPFWLRATRLSR